MGVPEEGEVSAEFVRAAVVIVLDGRLFQRSVHSFDLAVGPRVVVLGQAMRGHACACPKRLFGLGEQRARLPGWTTGYSTQRACGWTGVCLGSGLIDPEQDAGGDCDGGHESVRASVIAYVDAPPVLDASAHVFDLVSAPVECSVVRDRHLAVLA